MKENTGQPEVVVITGASAGVGRATVREFARRGAYIGLLARDQQRLESTREEVESLGGKALMLPTDVADHVQVEAAANAVEEAFGPIDIWINNASNSIYSPIIEMMPDEFKRITDVTYLGAVYGTLAALKRMQPRDHGTIVQVGSGLAYRSIPLQSAYCAAKHALQGFNESLRSELIHDKSHVHITMVQLPALNTPQFRWTKSRMPNKAQPLPPIFQPEVAARVIYWAAHHRRRELLVGWSTVQGVLLDKVIPGLLDRYLASKAYAGQQTDEPRDPNRPHNLWEPPPGDPGVHGVFDDRARSWSAQVWANLNRRWLAMAGAGITGLASMLVWKQRH